MSIVYIESDNNINIPLGKLIVIDQTSLKAREYDNGVDTVNDIVGVSYPKSNTTGRIVSNADGLGFIDYDYYQFQETLNYVIPLTANPNFQSWDPVNSSSPYYCLVAISGMVALDNTYASGDIPTSWRKIRAGTNYDVYLVR